MRSGLRPWTVDGRRGSLLVVGAVGEVTDAWYRPLGGEGVHEVET